MIDKHTGVQEVHQDRIALGGTDLRVSPLGVGTWAWGDRMTWGYGKGYGEDELKAAFAASLAAGINFYDTAEIYGQGQSERFLGRFIQESGQDVVIATKFMPFPWRLRRTDLLRSLHASLDRLGVPRVDLYQIHFPMPPVAIETWMESLAEAVESDLARAVGVSNYSTGQTRRAFAALARRGVPLTSNQVEYSLLQRKPERTGLLQLCQEQKITLIAYSPLAMGVLTGKYTPENPPTGIRGRKYNRSYLTRVQPLLEQLRRLGDAHGKSSAQVALNWVICKGAVPIPGAKNARQAKENAGAFGWRLAPDEVAALDAASDEIG